MSNRKITPQFKALMIIVVLIVIIAVLALVKLIISTGNEEPSIQVSAKTTGKNTTATEPNETAPTTENSSNAYAAFINYSADNLSRYEDYQQKNPTVSTENVVTMVNIGLDREYYTYTEEADQSLDNFIIVNKYHNLPEGYEPSDLTEISEKNSSRGGCKLRADAAEKFEELADAARDTGYSLLAYSGFRSYEFQSTIYNNLLKNDTQENVDTYSARPGYSEHQTGLAMDVCSEDYIYTDYDKDKGCEWVHQNMHKYGFILRYTDENKPITGYMAEAWHFRYVGVEAATYIYENNLTYEEYFDKEIKNK